MSALTLCLIIFGVMLALMAIRVPIAVSMFSAGTLGYLIQTGWGPYSSFLNNLAFARFASYDLSVIPLFILMRALGVVSDKDIIRYCLLDIEKNSNYVDFFIPSVHDANKVFNQETALEYIASFTKRGTISGVMEILSDYFLPHIGELNFLDKAYFVGYMTFRLLKVYNKEEKQTDRDNFRFKRVELTGSLIYDLFREYYLIQKKAITQKIDAEYYYHKGEYKDDETLSRREKKNLKGKPVEANKYQDNFIGLIESNVKTFFKDRIVEQGFRRAFKGNWGSMAYTKRLGVVQSLNRLSWNTFISHLRKLNLQMDPTSKTIRPRLLNNSQFGYIDILDCLDILPWKYHHRSSGYILRYLYRL